MLENIENLKIRSVLKRVSKTCDTVSERGAHGFNIRLSGTNVYTFADREFVVGAGEVIFIPKGARYSYRTTEGSLCLTINVEGKIENAEPFVCSLKDFYDFEFLENHFADLWRFGENYDKCQCKSKFYSFLSFIAKNQQWDYSDKKKFDIIEPAVEYLRTNIFSPDLRAEKLNLICGISNTYFREIFMRRFKTTPKEYIISKRVTHAKSIIDSGEFSTVKELALAVGYKDALYFGKAFKKIYGMSPTAFNK